MSDPNIHRIRLKGPWEIVPPASSSGEFERHAMPQDWRTLFGPVAGTSRFCRRFHRPTGLTPHDRVFIRFPEGMGTISSVTINENEAVWDESDPSLVDITSHLVNFNELSFLLSFDPAANPETPGGLWETAILEIHAG